MKRNGPRLVIALVAASLLLSAIGLGAAAVAYDRTARVAGDCDERFGGNSPSGWSVRGIASAVPWFDGSPLFVPRHEAVRIPSRDAGIELHGWWLPPRDGPDAPSVIVVHGFGTCMRDPVVLAPAGMLHHLGYGVLMLDLRDHGASTIEDGRAAAGTDEYRDVLGAVDWLATRGAATDRVGVFGASMGAAAAIMAAGHEERIAAVWADSGYADLGAVVEQGLERVGLPGTLAPLAPLVARLVSGDDLSSPTVLDELTRLSGRHLFVVHGTDDGLVDVSHAESLAGAARSAGVATEAWIAPDTGHGDAVFRYPEEYERRLAEFFGSALAA